ncbi:tRNA (guanine-N(7)-)-methyltransferase non-catalytic subunit wdr4 isoform X2 [Clupea harengus]|uniref:tRNA (Guanine-N(7)-)-methyltransferase non-catalytic subunit wdr4 isoform X2 n=1 Tax=Clupea harengus TaxID=7950 RepID=A0A6P8GAP3_CLUHA|nr:tRNA (guanine-N(7)-)-methyltransferase non-catalytic subunit wdr4 isoform X2 [Clupea harengus]
MAVAVMCGEWLVTASGKSLTAVHTRENREAFGFDCSQVEQKPKDAAACDSNREEGAEEKGSDAVLAVAASPSGRLLVLTDDRKRLLLLSSQPTWHLLSCRWVVRRCTALAFSPDEECVWVADKSGDVYSFSTTHTHTPGDLRLGHLSMLLALVVTADDRYVITADRDEKIRVSLKLAPHNIQSFCLAHTEFVSTLFVPPRHPDRLFSGSGDGTVKLWEYATGKRLQSCDLTELLNQDETDERVCIKRLSSSPDGQHLAVLCERLPRLQLFEMKTGSEVTPTQCLTLPQSPLDTTFDPQGRLWVLLDDQQTPVLLYTHTSQCWEQCDADQPDLKRVTEGLHTHSLPLPDARLYLHQLYKAGFDNTATYRQRKEERLQQRREPSASPQPNGAKRTRALIS